MLVGSSRLCRGSLIVAGAIAVWMLSACSTGHDYGYGIDGSDPVQEKINAARYTNNRDLERRVVVALESDPRIKIGGLQVKAQGDGEVTITGILEGAPMTDRTRVIGVTQRVLGVRKVVDNLRYN